MSRTGLGLLLAAWLGLGAVSAVAASDPFEAFALARFDSGIRAPAFTLPDLTGRPVSVSASGGPATLIVFWGTW